MGFTQWVDRRICDLGKTLLTVVPERTVQCGQGSRRGVVPHAPKRFLSVVHQRLEKHAELVFGPAESSHPALGISRGIARGRFSWRNDSGWQRNRGSASLKKPRNLGRAEENSRRRTGQQHLAGTKALTLNNVLVVEIGDAHFGADYQQAVGGERVAERTKPIAVELGPYRLTIAEKERSGTVPGLLLLDAALEKLPQGWLDSLVFLPSRRNKSRNGLCHGMPLSERKLQSVIEAC